VSVEDLFAAIDGALQPAGMLSDLSRIIAQFARSIRWAADERFVIDAEGARVDLKDSRYHDGFRLPWAVLDTPIKGLPLPPAPDEADHRAVHPHLRVWTIRINAADDSIFPGIIKPTRDPAYDANWDDDTYAVGTHHRVIVRGVTPLRDQPCTAGGKDAVGSAYRFTADLSAGTVRVRPTVVIPRPLTGLPPVDQTEWVLVEGIVDLGEYSASVGLRSVSAYTVRFE
jgi:hypothetical protein